MSTSPISSSFPGAQPMATGAAAASGTTSTATGGNRTDIGSTFLQLLTQELQNQDPTAPMDSTQMVGQMISLNQLQQLASINQTLSKSAGSASADTAAAATGAASAASAAAALQAALQAAQTGAGSAGAAALPGPAALPSL